MMEFRNKYPKLSNLLGAYLSDADLEYTTDEEVIANYRGVAWPTDVHKAQAELEYLIAEPSDWENAIDSANRYFTNNDEIHFWLLKIRHELSKQVS